MSISYLQVYLHLILGGGGLSRARAGARGERGRCERRGAGERRDGAESLTVAGRLHYAYTIEG
jgi:hypothetical protein